MQTSPLAILTAKPVDQTNGNARRGTSPEDADEPPFASLMEDSAADAPTDAPTDAGAGMPGDADGRAREPLVVRTSEIPAAAADLPLTTGEHPGVGTVAEDPNARAEGDAIITARAGQAQIATEPTTGTAQAQGFSGGMATKTSSPGPSVPIDDRLADRQPASMGSETTDRPQKTDAAEPARAPGRLAPDMADAPKADRIQSPAQPRAAGAEAPKTAAPETLAKVAAAAPGQAVSQEPPLRAPHAEPEAPPPAASGRPADMPDNGTAEVARHAPQATKTEGVASQTTGDRAAHEGRAAAPDHEPSEARRDPTQPAPKTADATPSAPARPLVETAAQAASPEVDAAPTGGEPDGSDIFAARSREPLHARAEAAPQASTMATATAIRQLNAPTIEILQRGGGTVDVALDPEELGRVRLSLSPSDNAITIAISAERSDTSDLLRRHAETLSADLKELGYTDISFSFGTSGDQSGDAQEQPDRPAETWTADATRPADDHSAISARPAPSSGLDLRL